MFEKILNDVANLIGSAPGARGANVGGPARMEANGNGHATSSAEANMGGAIGAAIARANAENARSLPPRISGSPADRLPAEARRRYQEILDEAGSVEAVSAAIFERVEEARRAMLSAEAGEANLRSRDGGRLDEDAVAVMDARAKGAAARTELERLRARQDEHRERAAPIRELARALQMYLEHRLIHAPDIAAAPAVAIAPLQAGETWEAAVLAKRARLQKLNEDLQAVIDAPRPSSVAKAMARAEIERLATRGRIGVMSLIEGGAGIEWPSRMASVSVVYGPQGEYAGTTSHDRREFDAQSLIAWLFHDRLLEAVERQIDEHVDDKSALDEPTRAKKRSQIARAILANEHEEEALITAAAEAGVRIERRPDADPRAVLQLSDTAPAPDRGLI